MAAAVIGALRVNLGMDSAQFKRGLRDSQSGLQKFANAAKIGLAAIAASATALGYVINSSIKEFDNLAKLSRSIGVPVEELSALRHAADLSGVSIDQLGTAMRSLSQRMVQVAQGSGLETRRAFEYLGIEAQNVDGTLRSSTEVMEDVAEAFAGMEDGAVKTGLSVAIFGRQGASMINMLNNGRNGLREMTDEARALGIVITQETAEAAERFNDNLTRLGRVKDGLIAKITSGLLPALESLSVKILDNAMEGGNFEGVIHGITVAGNLLIKGLGLVIDNLQHLFDLFKVFVAARTIVFIGSLAGSFITLAKTVRIAGLAMALMTKLTKVKITTLLLLAAVLAKVTGTYDDLVGFLERTGEAVMNALPEGLRASISDISASLGDLANGINGVDSAAAISMDRYINAANNAAGSFGTVGSAAQSAADSVDVVAERAKEASQVISGTLKSAFSGMFSDLRQGTSLVESFANKLGSLADRLFDMAISGLFDMLFSGLTGGLGFSPQLGQGRTGANVFGGGGGHYMGGFASGGSFKVPGAGGIDSQFVGMHLTPGERVDISPANANGTGGGLSRVVIELGDGLRASIVEESASTAVQIVDRGLPNKVQAINLDGRARRKLGF